MRTLPATAPSSAPKPPQPEPLRPLLGGFSAGFVPLVFGQDFFTKTRPFGVPVWRIGAGASMAFRRAVFTAIGTFDERLGAGASGCSEDSELWYRLLAGGWECRYEPSAVVFHCHRSSWKALERQINAVLGVIDGNVLSEIGQL